jgi:hypothetical protein
MTSKIIVNTIEADAGISSVTFNDTISGNVTGNVNSSGTSTFNVITGVSTIGVTTIHVTGINNINVPNAGSLGYRNLLINGGMKISQRGITASYTTSDSYDRYTLDRWEVGARVQSFEYTATQEFEGPVAIGSSHSAKINIDAVTSESDSSNLIFQQIIESQFVQHLKYGTSSAEPLALSFYVKSNKTGTYVAQLLQYSGTGNSSYSAFREFTVNTTDTWERKTLTYTGNTVGFIRNDIEAGLALLFHLHTGPDDQLAASTATASNDWTTSNTSWRSTTNQVNLADTINNYIQFSGVQLEVGTKHSEFEVVPYPTELALCQRYYVAIGPQGNNDYVNEIGVGYCESSSVARGYVQFPTTMRSNPTVTSDQLEIRTITGLTRNINTPTFETNENGVYIDASNSGFTAGAGGLIRLENNAGKLEADAEL